MAYGHITSKQFAVLMIMFIISSSTMLIPSLLTIQAKQDAWIAVLVGTVLSYVLLAAYLKLGSLYPSRTIVQSSTSILGKPAGYAMGFLYLLYFFLITAGLIRQLGDMLLALLIPDTPIQMVHGLMILLVVYTLYCGLESFARAAEIFIPWVLLLTTLLLLFLLPNIKLEHLLPIMEFGVSPVAKATFTMLGIPYLDLIIFLMLLPYVSDPQNVRRTAFTALTLGGGIVLLVTMYSILVLGAETSSRMMYPMYLLAQKVNVANFIQRIEVMIGAIWFISMFFKITVCFFATAVSTAQLFGLRDYLSILYPLALMLGVTSLIMSPNSIHFLRFLSEIWTPSVVSYGILLPLLLFGVHWLRKGSIRTGGK
jgi:spore germination protein KB